MTDKIINLY
uniref:Uncharacterized protein n=1 Tax=Romanomermis culicivorax TaxID=13658 RepID=A0A915J166_ROMCU